MKKLMNAENECSDSTDASEVEIVVRRIEAKEVFWAMNGMKIEKANGLSGNLDLEILRLLGISV